MVQPLRVFRPVDPGRIGHAAPDGWFQCIRRTAPREWDSWRAYVWQLSVGERQRVEIIKTLYRQVRLLILDEPTAVLTPQEVRDPFAVLKLLVISEDLDELMSISDRILVIYEGAVIDEADRRKTTREAIGLMMAGVSSTIT